MQNKFTSQVIEPLFYLQSPHGLLGTNVVFHNKNGAGYGTDLSGLREYSLAEAQQELGRNIHALPLLTSKVQELSIAAVDCQYLCHDTNHKVQKVSPDRHMIQVGRLWNGNDIAFVTGSQITYDFRKAEFFNLDLAQKYLLSHQGDHLTIWSQSYLETISRRTFQAHNINTRTMITKPGLLYKKPRKQRPTTGKTRMNCPDCGKIHWQYNPYDFEGCAHISCEGWRSSYS